ncbi:MAG: YdcF family protein, partial [Bacteroidota bacterium]
MQHIFFFLSKILDFLLSPLSWIVILLLISVITKNKKRSRKCLYWAIGAILFFSNPFVLNLVMHAWEIQSVSIDSIHKEYDAAIMMGGAIRYVNGQMQRPVFGSGADRYVQSLELFYRNKAKYIIISSGSGSLVYTDVKEADLLRNQMIRIGVPADKVI